MKEAFEKITARLQEEKNLLEEERKEAIEYGDEQIIFATNNQIRAFDYSLRVIREEARKCDDSWIPCSERLPKDCEHVLVCLKQGNVLVGYYTKGFEWYTQYGAFVFCDVTAWQPLPPAYQPKGEK